MSQDQRVTRGSVSRQGKQSEKEYSMSSPHSESDKMSFEDFVRNALTNLGTKMDNVLTGQAILEEKFNNLEIKVNTNTSELQEVKKSIDFESANIRDHNAQLQDLKAKFEHRQDEVERANSAIATVESEINSLERYTRGFNIRILGVAEHDGEDCIGRVQELLSDYFNVSEPVIENAHRVGVSRAGKPRQLIARFHSRAIRRDVISVAREKLKDTQYRMVDDLTAKDLDEKRRLRPLMEKLFKEKQRPRFINGRLYANGKPLPRETIHAYLSKLPS